MNSAVDWTLVRSFLAVVEAGSLSAAATHIGATHSTLSRHIRELETLLGVTLFTRSMRGVYPTEAALGLVDDARAMGQAAEALLLKAKGRSHQLNGTVRITASVVVGNLLLPPIIAALREAEPSIAIEIVVTDQAQNLLRRDADIAIRMFEPKQQALIARKLGETPIGLFGTRGYFERHGQVQGIEDLPNHNVIGFDRLDLLVKLYLDLGLPATRETFPIRCDDQIVQWNLLLAGAGLGFAQVLLANRCPELERVDIDWDHKLPVWMVMHEEVRTNARIRRVADFLSAKISTFLKDG